MREKSIKKNYIYNLSYQIMTLLTPLITTPYISRVLRPDGVGVVSYSNSVVTCFILFAVLGTLDYGQREIAYRQDDIRGRSRKFWEIFFLRTATSLLSLICFLLVTRKSEDHFIYLVQSLNIIAVIIDITWFFQGLEEFGKIVRRNIAAKILNILFVFMFVKSYGDAPLYVASIAAAALIGHVSLWISLPSYICRIPLKEIRPFRNIKTVLLLFLPQIATQVSTVMDKTMLGLIIGSDFENGYYEQADRIEKICLTVVTSLGTVMMPRIAHVIAQKQDRQLEYYIYRSYRFIWLLALPMTIGLIGIADQFVPWFLGDGYEKTEVLLRIFSMLLWIIGLSNVTGVQYFIPAGKQKEFTISVFLGMSVNFICNILLIPGLLSLGAAIATVIGEIAVTVSQLYMIRKRFSIRKIFVSSETYLISSGIMGIVILILKPFAGAGPEGSILLVAAGILVYFGVLLLMKDQLVRESLEFLMKIRKRRNDAR